MLCVLILSRAKIITFGEIQYKMKFAKGVLHLIAAIIAQHNNNLIVNAQPYTNCDVETYYSSLSSTTTPAREDLHALIKDTHRNELPYTSSSLPDVWDAMIALDSDASGLNVKLIYGDRFVPADPRESGSCDYWNREHL